MTTKALTLNRFPLFGLFAYRAAKRMGYKEDEAHLLGFSTAKLYAIYKAKAQAKKEHREKEAKKEPKEPKGVQTETLEFGGQEYAVVRDRHKHLAQTVVGHKAHDAADYESQVEDKFPEGWHDRLAKAFDEYLEGHDPDELNEGDTLFDLYKAWRDGCKVGFNRVDLEKLAGWLREHVEAAGKGHHG